MSNFNISKIFNFSQIKTVPAWCIQNNPNYLYLVNNSSQNLSILSRPIRPILSVHYTTSKLRSILNTPYKFLCFTRDKIIL